MSANSEANGTILNAPIPSLGSGADAWSDLSAWAVRRQHVREAHQVKLLLLFEANVFERLEERHAKMN